MKKLIYVGAFFFLGTIALSSCKKEHTCDMDGSKVTYSEKDYTDAQISAAKTACKLGGGTWE